MVVVHNVHKRPALAGRLFFRVCTRISLERIGNLPGWKGGLHSAGNEFLFLILLSESQELFPFIYLYIP